MIKEQKLKLINIEELLKIIKLKGKYLDQNEKIEIEFYGDKNLLENEANIFNKKNKYFVGKYKNIYIGSLSISEPFRREKFGLNKYFNILIQKLSLKIIWIN